MEGAFNNVILRAKNLLEAEGVESAVRVVKVFFEENQDEIKVYFDNKTLEETASEMKQRMLDIEAELLESKIESESAKHFLKLLEDFFQEEYDFRVREMLTKVKS